MKFYYLGAAVLLAACASNRVDTSHARQSLEAQYKDAVGKATKAEFIQDFGDAQWCNPEPGAEQTCRFYRKLGTKWIGQGEDKKPVELFDEIIASFDSNEILTEFKAKSQR